jgi:hypothetical protein
MGLKYLVEKHVGRYDGAIVLRWKLKVEPFVA